MPGYKITEILPEHTLTNPVCTEDFNVPPYRTHIKPYIAITQDTVVTLNCII